MCFPLPRAVGLQLLRAHAQLDSYLTCFRERLLHVNAMHCRKLLNLMGNLAQYLQRGRGASTTPMPPPSISSSSSSSSSSSAPPEDCIIEVARLLTDAAIVGFDLYELLRYLETSNLVNVLRGFDPVTGVLADVDEDGAPIAKPANPAKTAAATARGGGAFRTMSSKGGGRSDDGGSREPGGDGDASTPAAAGAAGMQAVRAFLLALSNPDRDGRILVKFTRTSGAGT